MAYESTTDKALRFDAIAPHTNTRTQLITELIKVYKDVETHAFVNNIPQRDVASLAIAVWTEEQRLRSISAEYNDLFKATVK